LPVLLVDLQRLLETDERSGLEVHAIATEVRDGFGTEASMIYNVNTLAPLNPDLRAVIAGLAREFGIRELVVMQQLALLTDKRIGNLDVVREKCQGHRKSEE
jgi:hypothetical protein